MSLTLRALLVLGGILLFSTTSLTGQYQCNDLNAVPVDTFTITYTTNPHASPLEFKLQDANSSWDIITLLTPGGTPSLRVPVESVSFSGIGVDSINSVTTPVLFLMIDYVSVRRALDSGAIPTPAPGNSYNLHVYHAGCVYRTGSGSTTAFTAGGNECCMKTFTVARPPNGGRTTINLSSSSGPTCTSLESTCEDDNVIFSLLAR